VTTILIADDHATLRDGLRAALTDAGFDVVGEAADGAEAIEVADRLRPDLVLMDVTMPVLDGIEATRRLLRRVPAARVVMLTMHADPELVGQARSAGAVGYLCKDASLPSVVEAVSRAAAGKSVLADHLLRREPEHTLVDVSDRAVAPGSAGPVPDSPLSPREEEILQLLADGRTPSEVAKELFISRNTVRNHLASIYEKLDVGDRTHAVVRALRLGFIHLQPLTAVSA